MIEKLDTTKIRGDNMINDIEDKVYNNDPCTGNCCAKPERYTPSHECDISFCEECYVTACMNCGNACSCDL